MSVPTEMLHIDMSVNKLYALGLKQLYLPVYSTKGKRTRGIPCLIYDSVTGNAFGVGV